MSREQAGSAFVTHQHKLRLGMQTRRVGIHNQESTLPWTDSDIVHMRNKHVLNPAGEDLSCLESRRLNVELHIIQTVLFQLGSLRE